MTATFISKTVFDASLATAVITDSLLTRQQADFLFQFFKDEPLFKWEDKNNNCEDRANAICLALAKWQIPAYKGWVFSGSFLKRNLGQLQNNWCYHVAALIAVNESGTINHYILDPATTSGLVTIVAWAAAVTGTPTSFHCISTGDAYIFDPANVNAGTWFCCNKQNYKWTIQGLAGINGVSRTGKAQVVFQKRRIKKWQYGFEKLLRRKPEALLQ